MNCDGQPNDVEEEVEHDDSSSNTEDGLVRLRIKEVHTNRDEEDALCHNPLDSAKLDVVNVSREVEAKDGDLGEKEVRSSLTVRRDKGRPCGATPPCYDEAE